MRILVFILFSVVLYPAEAQEEISVKLLDSISLNADNFIGVDDFENYYYTKGNTLYKQTSDQTYVYTNTSLGVITTVDITNPLKILLFYRDFNTIVILDNRLNELTDRINLSNVPYGKYAAFATIASNNNLWLFSLDDAILTLWNYEIQETVFDSQPLSFYLDDFETALQVSSYEYCWVLSDKGILQFNEFGSLIATVKLEKIMALQPYGSGVLYLEKDEVFYLENESAKKLATVNKIHLSTNFFVNKNTLYFFHSDWLYRYRILKN